MVTRTFLSKTNTIFENSSDNFGLNPIAMLNYGLVNSRVLIQFNVDKVSERIDTGEYTDKDKLRHVLKMYNCGSIDKKHFGRGVTSNDINGIKMRATSFDIIAFRITQEWDAGRGFDHSEDVWFIGDSAVSQQGSNWFQPMDGYIWEDDGIISEKTLDAEYAKYMQGEDSLIVATQHFEYGTEDLELDLTDYVNSLLFDGVKNKGICLCFYPGLKDRKATHYVGFFTQNTNTFYEPILETRYDDPILDDRNSFILGKQNRLYLYFNIDGEPTDLDDIPICSINGSYFPVTRQSEGVYYATVKLPKSKYGEDEILEDIWSEIKYDGEDFDNIVQEFVTNNPVTTKPKGITETDNKKEFVTLSGIDNDEKLNRDEIRMIEVILRRPYEGIIKHPNKKMEYRVYVMDAYREVDVIDWDTIDITSYGNYFTIDTSELLPQEYHVDIKYGKKAFHDELRFKIINNATKQAI